MAAARGSAPLLSRTSTDQDDAALRDPAPADSHDAWHEASTAVEDLRDALHAHGINLPELSLDLPGVMADYPLVNLGAATADTVRQIIQVLLQAAR